MDIALPMDSIKADYVTQNQNSIVFFKNYPKKIKIGDNILIFETGNQNGTKGIKGVGTVDEIIPVVDDRGRWPQPGCYPFIEYYVKYIQKDEREAARIKQIKNDFRWKLPNYKLGYILDFVYCPDELEYIREHEEPIPIEFNIAQLSQKERTSLKDRVNQKEKARNLQMECDQWLRRLGFYDEFDTSFYKYGIILKNVKRYHEPLDLSHYVDDKGLPIRCAPKSWRYVQEN